MLIVKLLTVQIKESTHNFQLPYTCHQGKESAACQSTLTIDGEYMLNGEHSQSRKKQKRSSRCDANFVKIAHSISLSKD